MVFSCGSVYVYRFSTPFKLDVLFLLLKQRGLRPMRDLVSNFFSVEFLSRFVVDRYAFLKSELTSYVSAYAFYLFDYVA